MSGEHGAVARLRTTRRHPLDGSSVPIVVAAGQRVTTLCVFSVP